MAVGDVHEAQMEEYRDPDTGALVRRLTGDGSDNAHLYFTSTSFVGEDAERVIISSDRAGGRAYFLLEIPRGQMVQVTEAGGRGFSQACLDPAGRLFHFDGRTLQVTDLSTLESEDLYQVPEGFRPALPTCTADGDHVAFAYVEQAALSTETGVIYSTMAERYYQHPSCVVMRVQTRSGEAMAVWGERNWISHVVIHPTDPDLILFCHEGGWHVSQRMWTVDAGEQRGRRARPLFRQHHGEACCHEYFTRDGDVGFQCNVTSSDEALAFNCFVRPDGTWLRQFLLPGPRPGHIQSNSDNTLVVGDCGYRSPDDPEGRAFMSLIEHRNGRGVVTRLCRHDTSWERQISHPHPIFSPDDRWALFSSDRGGAGNVYMADVTSI
ncbi:MAG: oligogalacturonate lyase family protein [Armatimonadota bacterium]|nr:oligogalacturonate lyase family protein [Armatimonadota bacterium]